MRNALGFRACLRLALQCCKLDEDQQGRCLGDLEIGQTPKKDTYKVLGRESRGHLSYWWLAGNKGILFSGIHEDHIPLVPTENREVKGSVLSVSGGRPKP